MSDYRLVVLGPELGEADAVCFTPFNKKAMRYAYEGYDDEFGDFGD